MNVLTSLRQQLGAATLLISAILLVTITLIILFAANYNIFQQKITTNTYQSNQAFEAAEAGLDFSIVYFQVNNTAIAGLPVNGYIPAYTSSSTANVTLANGSKFTISYTNPIQNNYSKILASVTGTSSDGTTTRTLQQQIAKGTLVSNPPTSPLVTKGSVNMTGGALIANPTGSTTINSASSVSFSGANAKTTITGGVTGSSNSGLGSDVTTNNSSLNSMSNEAFFQSFFGASTTTVKSTLSNYYSNSSNTNYNSLLNGKSGTSIWIDQTGGEAVINSNTVIGSPTNPVLLIVNGNLNLSGNAVIYGLVFVIGGVDTDLTGNAIVYGGLISTGSMSLAGNSTISYNTAVLNSLQQQAGVWAKIPGTWKDF